jgi:hypothetical protein
MKNDTSAPRQNPALIDQCIDLDPAAPVEVSAIREPGGDVWVSLAQGAFHLTFRGPREHLLQLLTTMSERVATSNGRRSSTLMDGGPS